jgi:hypothetical protein
VAPSRVGKLAFQVSHLGGEPPHLLIIRAASRGHFGQLLGQRGQVGHDGGVEHVTDPQLDTELFG